MTEGQKQDFILRWRQGCTSIINAAQGLTSFKVEYDALDLGNVLKDSDFKNESLGITKQEFIDSVAAVDGILKGLDAGTRTVVYKVKI